MLAEAALRTFGRDRTPKSRRRAQHAIRNLAAASKRYPVFQPRLLHFQAVFAVYSGRRLAEAQRLVDAASARASELNLVYDKVHPFGRNVDCSCCE